MRQYWHNLQLRERIVLSGGVVVLLVLLLYLLVLEPWQQEIKSLQQNITSQQETLQWMQQAATEIQTLRSARGDAFDSSSQSLMGSIDTSARAAGISPAIRQMRPDAQGVVVRLENAGFDDTLRWLGRLYSEQGIQVTSFTMERLPQPGKIHASVSLAR